MGLGPIINGKATPITPYIGSWAHDQELKRQGIDPDAARAERRRQERIVKGRKCGCKDCICCDELRRDTEKRVGAPL